MSVGTSDYLRQISHGSSIRLSWEGLNQGEAYEDSELHTHEILGPILQGYESIIDRRCLASMVRPIGLSKPRHRGA